LSESDSSATPTSFSAPVSAALVAELREEARKEGVLVWLDKQGTYTEFVDSLIQSAGNAKKESSIEGSAIDRRDFPWPVLGYRGSFLELMLELDGHGDGITKQPLVVHMPGYNSESIKQTPLYEMYRAGRCFRVALETLTRRAAEGRVVPTAIDEMLRPRLDSLAEADRRLSAALSGQLLGGRSELAISSPAQLFNDLAEAGPLSASLDEPESLKSVLDYLERTLGLDERWRSSPSSRPLSDPRELQLLISSWALCVEFVHDLKREPKEAFLLPLTKLPKTIVEKSRELASHIRRSLPETYAQHAGEVESSLPVEVRESSAEDLGRIDTFEFEDKKVFSAAISALNDKKWEQARDYAADRTEKSSFWVRRDHGRRTGWQVIEMAAELGLACSRHANLLARARGLDAAVRAYEEHGFEVDLAQRRLEQARCQLPLMELDEFPALRRCLNGLRFVYRQWADKQAVEFNALCKTHGFLPEPALQQRTIFNQVVRPLVEEGGPVAYFVVDALRFEMGHQLADWLGREGGTKVQLKARCAELPTLTEVGMNALAPIATDGKLQLEISGGRIQGFRAGETRIDSPKTRQKAMHERVGGETCPWISLEELLDREVSSLRQAISRARLVIIHAEGLDTAGEKGVGLRHFEDELQRLRAAWAVLREVGVQSFVIASDHGFLLQDETTRKPVRHGRKTEPKRRHVIENVAADHDGEVRVSSTELRYEGEEVQFMFPETTMPFDTGANAKEFLHGGNSLQERVVPVLTARYRHAKGSSAVQYRIEARAESEAMGLHLLKGRVLQQEQQHLTFGRQKEVELRLNALDGHGVAVELLDAVGARIEAGALVVAPDADFEVRFRLTGPEALRTGLEIGPALRGDEVIPFALERRFTVTVFGPEVGTSGESAASADTRWLDAFQDEGVRAVFEHIQHFHGINEKDATRMLGGPRKFRRFSQQFEQYSQRAPFEVRIDVSSGQKRYVREGG
jgi:hypothetical protein